MAERTSRPQPPQRMLSDTRMQTIWRATAQMPWRPLPTRRSLTVPAVLIIWAPDFNLRLCPVALLMFAQTGLPCHSFGGWRENTALFRRSRTPPVHLRRHQGSKSVMHKVLAQVQIRNAKTWGHVLMASQGRSVPPSGGPLREAYCRPNQAQAKLRRFSRSRGLQCIGTLRLRKSTKRFRYVLRAHTAQRSEPRR